jgi:hypothetical protein
MRGWCGLLIVLCASLSASTGCAVQRAGTPQGTYSRSRSGGVRLDVSPLDWSRPVGLDLWWQETETNRTNGEGEL